MSADECPCGHADCVGNFAPTKDTIVAAMNMGEHERVPRRFRDPDLIPQIRSLCAEIDMWRDEAKAAQALLKQTAGALAALLKDDPEAVDLYTNASAAIDACRKAGVLE